MPNRSVIIEDLFLLQDISYKAFSSKLMPNVSADTVIGVRMPELRKLAKRFGKDIQKNAFLKDLPHGYFEENNLHGLLINDMLDFDACIQALDDFLPYVDNWATCDLLCPKCFKNNTDKLLGHIYEWLDSERTYTVRFAVKMLMTFYLDDLFEEKYLYTVASIKSGEYYVNMMQAWYFATSLAKQWDKTVVLLQKKHLPKWVHNKTIQKAKESLRITDVQKGYLNTLKIIK